MVTAEKTATGVKCSVKGSTEDTIFETVAIIAAIINNAIEFDAEDGQRLAQTSVFEIMERVKAYSMNKYKFDVFDIDILTKLIVIMNMQERDAKTTKKEGESE